MFLYHAIKAGMTMGIANAGQLGVYEEIPKDLLERVEDIILNRRPDAAERMVTAIVLRGEFDLKTALSVLELARALERATDRLAGFGHLLREHVLADLST